MRRGGIAIGALLLGAALYGTSGPIRDHGPDLAWAFGFTLAMRAWWGSSPEGRIWSVGPVLVGVGWEIGQGLGRFPGTGDPLDVAAYALGAAFAGRVR